ncbi:MULTISPECIES: hypothetical protein [unclassified Brevundimonas]|jgi:hypothetical protein|uniref:hypothetical protein n=1 Tax=unclassified Brevundimonas TaxID=2622653 RepID=UPI000CFDE03E|nr:MULTISPECIES: hypothetical protein [unclassified Brevundimonas]PRA33310.1 hypothetical protein CQ024_04905 [Brevundimonas sp. MYb27]PQZ83851.1 hypothetical protein CQ026_03400 [Brevundimonas sp. MYb31]PRB13780.1 hypothetical protein CQ039_11590 [Brevundimonas sp. MYb52]PRB34487.1 hypothetical protein CQ035_10735 [Brevundimonas sp. MYb46]PRB53965.1 hypothetical protein CQ028_05380 [Brevundimonas sp. MYb33]
MDTMTALILVGVVAMILAGAGFAFVQPRRFTDRDADGAPDATPEEIAQARADDAWGRATRNESKTGESEIGRDAS